MGEQEIRQFFADCSSLRILIVGDVMVDRYIWGDVDRISPEAPVPVISVDKRENRLGGAANVALNIRAMGATPLLCSVIGKDEGAEAMLARMNQLQISTDGIIQSRERQTTIKSRILCRAHQMLRMDEEKVGPLTDSDESALEEKLTRWIAGGDIDAIIMQDYNKGILSASLIRKVIELGQKSGIPVCVDPKKENFFNYSGCELFKPNMREISESLNNESLKPDLQSLNRAADELREKAVCTRLMVTLSENGVFLNENGIGRLWPAAQRKVADVSGAGDTVIAISALGIGGGYESELWVQLANLAGGQVCERPGVVAIIAEQLLEEALHFI